MNFCPACGQELQGSLADHGVLHHGARRPQALTLIAAVLAGAGALCAYAALRFLADVVRYLNGDVGGALTALVLLVVLVVGSFAAALMLVARMLWRGDRAGRVLAFVLCGSIAFACLSGRQASGALVAVGLACLVVIGVLALVPEVTAWFTGPFALHGDENALAAAARTLAAWTAYLSGVSAAVYLIIATIDASKLVEAVLFGAAAGLLASSFRGLAEGRQSDRVRASAGAGVALFASLVAGDYTVGSLAMIGPAATSIAFLWWPELSATSLFTSTGIGSHPTGPSTNTEGEPPGSSWPSHGFEDAAPRPEQYQDPMPLPVGEAASAQEDFDWPDLDLEASGGTAVPVGPPKPYGEPGRRPDPNFWGDAPSLGGATPAEVAPVVATPELLPARESRRCETYLQGRSVLSANRVGLLFVLAGATFRTSDGTTAVYLVPGGALEVTSTDTGSVVTIGTSNEAALSTVVSVVTKMVRQDDARFVVAPLDFHNPPSSVTPVETPPRGCYPDPFKHGSSRHWDGNQWSASPGR